MKSLFTSIAALGTLLFATATANAQLIHSYTFDNAVTDGVGSANGTLTNGATVGGGTLNLDGVDDFVQFGQKIVPASGAYSVTLFAKQTAAQSGYTEFISQGFSTGPGFYMGFSNAGRIRLTDSWQNVYAAPTDGVWHHYALVVGNGASQFYLDGTLRASLPSQLVTTLSGTDTRFGTQFSNISEYFRGSLDDIQVYGSALTGPQVAALASAGPSTTVVPEAGTACLALPALGVIGVVLRRRRK